MEICKQSGDSAAFLCIRPLVKAGELILIGRGVCVGKQSWDAVIRKEEAGVGNFCTHWFQLKIKLSSTPVLGTQEGFAIPLSQTRGRPSIPIDLRHLCLDMSRPMPMAHIHFGPHPIPMISIIKPFCLFRNRKLGT